jgi:hypothetical protein
MRITTYIFRVSRRRNVLATMAMGAPKKPSTHFSFCFVSSSRRHYLYAILLLLFGSALTACGTKAVNTSSEGPPTVVCGHTLEDATPAAPVVWSYYSPGIYKPSDYLPSHQKNGNGIYLRFSSSCTNGVRDLTFSPVGIVKVVSSAPATNGSLVALGLYGVSPGQTRVQVITSQGKRIVVIVRVR